MGEGMDAAAVLGQLEGQPEHVRSIFIYAICQTMVEAGLLEFKGASALEGVGTILMYQNPDSGQLFEIIKPDIEPQDEEAIRTHIRELLEKQGTGD